MIRPRPSSARPLAAVLLSWVALAWSTLGHATAKRRALLRADADRGSISVEKAVITAISLALALALMGAIGTVVNHYIGLIE